MGRADLAQCSTLITPFYSDLTEFQVPGWPSKVWFCLHKCTLKEQSRSSSPQPGQDRCPKCATWNILVPLCVICCRAVPGAEAQCGECWYSQKEHFRLELACSSTEGKKSDLPKLDLKKRKPFMPQTGYKRRSALPDDQSHNLIWEWTYEPG